MITVKQCGENLNAFYRNQREKELRSFSGEFEAETEFAELTQFNKDGEKIAHFIYLIPDLNPADKEDEG